MRHRRLRCPRPSNLGQDNQVHRSCLPGSYRRLHGHSRTRELRRRLGALEPLAKITKGTPVYVTDATGTRHEYKANTAETLTKTGLPQELFAPAGPPQLVLITCGGPIDNTGSILEYTHNTVVTAAPTTVP
ncbi:class F sortase [Arthrobacter sp. zg-Y820]|uniref:class F sortase n=1 Tax=Arthrobacter sp. zg-Y820 TaxID=2894192 RepID=UPI003FA4A7D2